MVCTVQVGRRATKSEWALTAGLVEAETIKRWDLPDALISCYSQQPLKR